MHFHVLNIAQLLLLLLQEPGAESIAFERLSDLKRSSQCEFKRALSPSFTFCGEFEVNKQNFTRS